jgi:hypothetical protein
MTDHQLVEIDGGNAWLSSHHHELPSVEVLQRKELQLIAGLAGLADRNGLSQIIGYAGWTIGRPPRRLLRALGKALPFPLTLKAALAEWREWYLLEESRRRHNGQRLPQPLHIRARLAVLAELLCKMSDPTIDGIRARFTWLDRAVENAFFNTHEVLVLTESLRRDFEGFVTRLPRPESDADSKTRPWSHAEKRDPVLRLLKEQPQLSDREIARRCGVSAPMVGKWRRLRRHV